MYLYGHSFSHGLLDNKFFHLLQPLLDRVDLLFLVQKGAYSDGTPMIHIKLFGGVFLIQIYVNISAGPKSGSLTLCFGLKVQGCPFDDVLKVVGPARSLAIDIGRDSLLDRVRVSQNLPLPGRHPGTPLLHGLTVGTLSHSKVDITLDVTRQLDLLEVG